MDMKGIEERAVQEIMGRAYYIQDSRGFVGRLLSPMTGREGVYVVREFPKFDDDMDMERLPICGGLPLATGAFILASYLAGGAALADEPKAEQPKSGYGISFDGDWADGQSTSGRLEVFSTEGRKRQYGDLVRLEHGESDDGREDSYGMRVPVKLDFFEGDVMAFGTDDSKGRWGAGVGVDARIKIPSIQEMIDLKTLEIGGALERSRYGDERDLADIYAGAEMGPVAVKLGYGHIFDRLGRDQDILHGVGFLDFGLGRLGKGIVGLGGTADLADPGHGSMVFSMGIYGGKDISCRLLGSYCPMGSGGGSLMVVDGGLKKSAFVGPVDIWDGGMTDLQIIPGVMDFKKPGPLLIDYAESMGICGRVSHSGGKTRGAVEAALSAGALRKLGIEVPEELGGLFIGGSVEGIGSGPRRVIVVKAGYGIEIFDGCRIDAFAQMPERGPAEAAVSVEIK